VPKPEWKCETCLYWFNVAPVGECRRKPPEFTESITRWPSAREYDWCGEWKAIDRRNEQEQA
jgi:hypothetical protein